MKRDRSLDLARVRGAPPFRKISGIIVLAVDVKELKYQILLNQGLTSAMKCRALQSCPRQSLQDSNCGTRLDVTRGAVETNWFGQGKKNLQHRGTQRSTG